MTCDRDIRNTMHTNFRGRGGDIPVNVAGRWCELGRARRRPHMARNASALRSAALDAAVGIPTGSAHGSSCTASSEGMASSGGQRIPPPGRQEPVGPDAPASVPRSPERGRHPTRPGLRNPGAPAARRSPHDDVEVRRRLGRAVRSVLLRVSYVWRSRGRLLSPERRVWRGRALPSSGFRRRGCR